ncbi:HD domain-containing protein [Primorskyibacter sp. S87]|uniref:HD domain-containing protein n=1 Tax=Primorskyibacter sp. S87 TaxID=3415126 RepID=UPI003C7D0F7B
MSRDPAHDLAHLDRVWTNAQAIADNSANMLVLLAACYLHDLENLPKDDPDRHLASRRSADAAKPILSALGYSEADIGAVGHAIEAHSFSAGIPPESIEAQILRDADRLDALGAVGIARTFVVAGGLGRAIYDPADPFAESRPLNELQFSIDHWKVKLLKLPNDMLTDRGRVLAQARTTRMLQFLDDLGEEIGAVRPADWR